MASLNQVMSFLSLDSAKKTMGALLVTLVAVNSFGVLMNHSANSSLGSQCSVYVADTASLVVEQSSDYNRQGLLNFVASNSIPKWVNPSWRIPSVSIVDAKEKKAYVQGDIVENSNDDQYNIIKAGCVLRFVDKLEAVNGQSGWTFPITMTWTQIEGADVLHILKMHVFFVAGVSLWTIIIGSISFRGHEFFQHYVLLGAFATVWFAGSVNTARNAMLHPPTAGMIGAIPEDQRSNVLQPCHQGNNTSYCMGAVWFSLILQVVVIVLVMLVGKRVAALTNEANGTEDPWYLSVKA